MYSPPHVQTDSVRGRGGMERTREVGWGESFGTVSPTISWAVALVGKKILMFLNLKVGVFRRIWIFKCLPSTRIWMLGHCWEPLLRTNLSRIFSRLHKRVMLSRLGDMFRGSPPPQFWQSHANIGIQKYFVTFLGNASPEGIATQPPELRQLSGEKAGVGSLEFESKTDTEALIK